MAYLSSFSTVYSGTSQLRPPMGLVKAGLNCEVVLILKLDYNSICWNTFIFGTAKGGLITGVVSFVRWSLGGVPLYMCNVHIGNVYICACRMFHLHVCKCGYNIVCTYKDGGLSSHTYVTCRNVHTLYVYKYCSYLIPPPPTHRA